MPIWTFPIAALLGALWIARRGLSSKIHDLQRIGIYPEPGRETPEHVRVLAERGETLAAAHLHRKLRGGSLLTARRAVRDLARD